MPSSAEISARLNGDNSNFRSMLNQAELATSQAGKRLTKNLDLRDASRTMAAAIGLNIQSIAENFARMWTGVSKQAEESFKRIGELSDRIAEKTIANNLARLNDDQRQTLLLKERANVELAISNNNQRTLEDQVKMKENLLRLAELTGEIEKKQRADALAESKKLDAFLTEAHERQAKAVSEAGARRQQNYDQQKKADDEHLSYIEKNRELLLLEAKSSKGLTEEEASRLKVLRLIIEQRERDYQITSLLSLKKRTPEEEALLQSLIKQTAEIDKQLKAKTELVEKTEEQKKLEETIIEITTTGRGDKQLSDRELERKIANLKADIAKREAALSMAGSMAGSSAYDPLLDPQKSNLQQTLNEIDLRRDVRRSVGIFGEDAAFNMFPGITESRFREILGSNTEQMKQTLLLEQIVEQQRKGIVTVPIGT